MQTRIHPALSPYLDEDEWRSLTDQEQLQLLRGLGIRDMNVLIQCILWPTDGKKILLLKPFHLQMIQLFMDCIRGATPQKELLYLIPRYHLKTQLITTAGAIWVLLNDPNESILVNSQHLDLAERIVGGAIRPIFTENHLFRACYPEWCPPDNKIGSWGTQSKIILPNRTLTRKEPSVMAGSFEAPKTGDHFGVLLNDDPHNEKNISTQDQIEKVKEGLKAQMPLGDGNRTRRIYVATRWHSNDVNEEIMKVCSPRFHMKFHAKKLAHNEPIGNIESDDECAVFFLNVWANPEKTAVIWPEKESYENILKHKTRMGVYFFACQMENDPVPEEQQTFSKEHFRYYDRKRELDDLGREQEYFICGETKISEDSQGVPAFKIRKIPVSETTNFMTVDPAFGIKPHNDYTGIVVAAHWTEPKTRLRWIIVLEIVREKMIPTDAMKRIDGLARKWSVRKVGIEASARDSLYTEGVERELKWAGREQIEMVCIRRGSEQFVGKARVTRLEPYYQSHRIWHKRGTEGNALEQELMGFVGGRSRGMSDDLADAMSDHVDFGSTRKNPGYNQLAYSRGMDKDMTRPVKHNDDGWGSWNPKRVKSSW